MNERNVRGLYATDQDIASIERCFAAGDRLWEINSDGTFIHRGSLAPSGRLITMVSNPTQLLACAGGGLFCLDLATNVLTPVRSGLQGEVEKIGFTDGYFVALLKDSQKFQISDLEDGTTWDATKISQVSKFTDNLKSMLIDHSEIWLFGATKTIVYGNSGNPDFPFEPIPGAFIEQGIAAPDSPVRMDNSVYWIGKDERGQGIAWRAQGYVPNRVSNHAIENEWRKYPKISDAVGYSFQENGHTFWHIYFPSANTSWRLDAATGMWCEVGRWETGKYTAHRSQCHAFCFGKHLVGDWNTNKIYEMGIDITDDDGLPLRRMRRAPHLSNEQQFQTFKQLQVHIESGLAPEPPLTDGNGDPREPAMQLRWSDDGGHTWSNYHEAGCGFAGEYKKRVMWKRLGYSRDRIFEISYMDTPPIRVVEAYLK